MNLRFDITKTVAFDLETIADPAAIPFLPPVEANGSLKDPVKIAADIAKKEQDQIDRMGLNPWTSYIAAFGWKAAGNEGVILLEDATPEGEATLLEHVWFCLSKFKSFITFNGSGFDIPLLMAHSLLRGVLPEVQIDTAKYKITNHMDVRAVLTGWDSHARGNLDFFTKRILGASPKDGGVDGSMVQGMWDQGLKEEIGAYCLEDVRATWELGWKVNEFYLF